MFLKEFLENLNMHGSIMAEVDHSSDVAHLDPSRMMSIMDQLTKLLER